VTDVTGAFFATAPSARGRSNAETMDHATNMNEPTPVARSLGHGFGLRTPHYDLHLEHGVRVPCVEIISENIVGRGGRPLAMVERVRKDAEVFLHGVSLSIGGLDPLNESMLFGLRDLARQLESKVVSDHLCFGTFEGRYGHDLWPLPYTEEAIAHVSTRVMRVQDILGRKFALENVSSYVSYAESEMSEWEFFAEVTRRADCEILLDINNIVVSSHNHGFDPLDYLAGIPALRVVQYHLAGHSVNEGYRFDDHGSPVSDEVWALYQAAVQRFGDVSCIVEWDENVPDLPRLEEEAARAKSQALLAKGASS
jgi:uncharacterized protein